MTSEQMLAAVRLDMERRGLLESSIIKREICLKALGRWLQCSPLEASREDLERFLDQRKTRQGAHIGPRTRFTWLANLAAFYRWALAEELIEEDPTAKIIRPKLRRSLPRPADTEQLRRLIERAGAKERCWVLLASYQGLRCKEIAGLRREDVVEHKGLIRVLGKGDNERLLPLHPDVLAALVALPLPRSGPVFTRARGGRYSANAMSAYFNEFLRNNDAGATAHQLRHWFGTTFYANTQDLRLTQEMMGHADPATTAIYTKFSNRAAAVAIKELSFAAPSEPDPEPHIAA
jgi:site-specific recombinase XerD